MNLQLTDRDLSFFEYLHENKVATVKQIRRDLFKVSPSTAWERFQKLRVNGFIKSLGNDFQGDKSTIFCLGKRGQDLLYKRYAGQYTTFRCQSNSVEHDLRLVDIRKVLSEKTFVANYWTENTLQTSLAIAEDESISRFLGFQFDAIIRLENQKGDRLLCGLEFESSAKSRSDYESKLGLLYHHSFLEVVFYISTNRQIENALKKVELGLESEGDKKLYFLQHSEFILGGEKISFRNQDSQFIVIK